jgi:hypothetical protein
MLYKQSGSKYYWSKFQWRGETYRKSTGATNRKTARAIEGTIRADLAQENYGILQPKEVPTVGGFPILHQEQLSHRRATKDYYFYGLPSSVVCGTPGTGILRPSGDLGTGNGWAYGKLNLIWWYFGGPTG